MDQSGNSDNDKKDLFSILVVEDSPDHRELIRRAFAHSPLTRTVHFCQSISEARSRLAAATPDLVLADIRLPDGNGRELLVNAGNKVPLVLMTSFGDETQAASVIKSGALDYVAKTEESFAELPSICWRAVRDWRAQTNAREAQSALAASEKRYRTLFENVPAGIFQCDPGGRLTEVNQALVEMLGYPDAEALSGLSLHALFLNDDEHASDEGVAPKNLLTVRNAQVGLRRFDGGITIAAMSVQPVRDGECICCYEGFFYDLTKQLESDAALMETRLRMEAAFRNVFGFIVLVDPDGNVLDMSDSVVAAMGCRRAAVEGSPLWHAPWWRSLDGEVAAVKAGITAARSGTASRDTARFATASGEIRIGDRSFTPVTDQAGEVRFIVVEGRDISDLIEANNKLEESEQRFRSLFESASEALVVYDVKADVFIDLNRKMEQMFGGARALLLKQNALTLSPEFQPDGSASSQRASEYVKLAVAGEAPMFEWEFQALTGERVMCEVRLNRVKDSRRVLVRGSLTDITLRKEAENRLRDSQRRMSALIENATSGIFEIDADGRVISANPVAVGILARNAASEAIGSNFLSYVPYDERDEVQRALDAAWRGHDSSLVYSISATSGKRIIASSVVSIRDSQDVATRVMLMCDDVTERHENAKKLEKERRFTESVINSLPGTFFVFEEGRRLVRFNDRFLAANGYAIEEARDMQPLDFIHHGDRPRVARKLRELFESGEASVEADLLTKDGRRVPFAYSGRALEQDGKRFLVGFGLDISERRRNERRFRAEKKFADTVINAMPGVFYVVNEERRIVRWNDNLLRIIGRKPEEMAALQPMSLVAEADRKVIAGGLEDVFKEGEARVEARLMNADGEERPFLLTGVRLRSGSNTFMVGMGFDISERKRFESQLRASENYLRSVVESEPECVWTLDRDGRLLDINPAGRMLLGDDLVDSARADSIVNFIRPDQRKAFLQLNESVFSGHSGILIFEMESQGGVLRWLETHAVALRDGKGRITAHLAVTRDITEKRGADAKIREYSDRLQKLSKRLLDTQEVEKRHLARELHDEVGQSLTALKLNMGHGVADDLGRSSAMTDSMQIIDRVLEQIRDLSLNLRPAVLDDLGLLPALRWYVDSQARRANLVARLSADSLTGVRLQSDVETAAFRIVQEALTNVLRHAKATSVDIDIELRGDRLSLEVRDNGRGFDAFTQMSKAASGGSFGLLGLKERAVLLGGAAFIDSSPGKGAKVAAWLPIGNLTTQTDIARAG